MLVVIGLVNSGDDRNWVVVSQSAAAGTEASTATPVTLTSKKIGE